MGIVDEIERLQALRERGALTPEEFERAKARLLAEQAALAGNNAGHGAGSAPGADPAGFGDTETLHAPGAADTFLRQLARSRTDRLLGGVCGGLGRHTRLPSWAWRLIFCLVTLYFGAGLLFYLLLWLFLPLEPAA